MTIKSRIKKITPEYAQKLLTKTEEAGIVNRKVNQRTVDMYVKALRAGKWKLNGEDIKLDEKGYIIDGQHRLLACVKSGITMETCFKTGVPRDSFDTIDCGRIRNGNQVLQMAGVPYHVIVNSIILGIREYEAYGHMDTKEKYLAQYELLEEYEKHPKDYVEAAQFAMKCVWESHFLTPKLVGTLYFHLVHTRKADKAKVEEFFSAITSFNTAENKVADKLRVFLNKTRSKNIKVRERLLIAYLIKTWNAFITEDKAPRFGEHDDEDMPSFI